MSNIIRRLSPYDAADTLVDLGTGDGALLARVVDIVDRAVARRRPMRLLIVDQEQTTLAHASHYLRTNIRGCVDIVTERARVEDWSIETSIDPRRILLIHSCACIHHLTREQKSGLFSQVAATRAPLLVSELEANHDSPASGSSELIYSAFTFYEYLMSDAASSLSGSDVRLCNDQFLLEEAIPLITEPYSERQNYHMLDSEWTQVAEAAGCHVRRHGGGKIAEAAPRSLLLWCEGRRVGAEQE